MAGKATRETRITLFEKAQTLATAISTYGGLHGAARGGLGRRPRVRVEMKHVLSSNLPYDVNSEHFDTVVAVALAARIKGREEALLSATDISSSH